MVDNNPIGIFDSGVGGLTLVKELRCLLPQASLLYLGDTARLPYGTKTAEIIQQYAEKAVHLLLKRKIQLLVVACNTVSAVAISHLRTLCAPIPVIGVITPGAQAACRITQGHIAVIGTERTIESGAYTQAIHTINPHCQVQAQSASLLVALAEEGWLKGPEITALIHRYLAPLWTSPHSNPNDTLILGCTHFPILKESIQAALPINHPMTIIDPARETALIVQQWLNHHPSPSPSASPGRTQYLVTDGLERFKKVAHYFLGETIQDQDLEWIAL